MEHMQRSSNLFIPIIKDYNDKGHNYLFITIRLDSSNFNIKNSICPTINLLLIHYYSIHKTKCKKQTNKLLSETEKNNDFFASILLD